MKKAYLMFVGLVIVFVGFIAAYVWLDAQMSPVSSLDETVRFVVPKGSSASQVGALLYKEGLIKNKLAFKIYVQFTGKTGKINAGEFNLSPSMGLAEIVDALGKGALELWVTIPEGLRREEIIEKVIALLEMEDERAKTFREEFLTLSQNSEGYLFPDTYLFPREADARTVFNKLTSTFEAKYKAEVEPLTKKSKFSKEEVVIMASILERETKSVEEKPIVAGILWKRIENDWPLQVDASVQYAVANAKCQILGVKCAGIDWWPILTIENLDIKSPYNTYKNQGLPASAIANPGIAALKAAASPTQSDYWFYIHSTDGIIHYAETAEDHAYNIRKYLGKS